MDSTLEHPSTRSPTTAPATRTQTDGDVATALSLIIPCFNEVHGIGAVLKALPGDLGTSTAFEIIVVDDGSTDGSYEAVQELAEEIEQLRLVRHGRNRGYGAALKSGIRHARGEYVAITDADGTYPNERISALHAECQEADMVVGSRTGDNVTYSRLRSIPKVFMRRYCEWVTQSDIPDMNSGLRVFRREVVMKLLHLLPSGFSFTTTVTIAMLTNDYRVKFVPIDYSRRIGKSKISPIMDTLRFTQLILRTALYFAPLRVFSPLIVVCWIGFFAALSIDVFYLKNLSEKTLLLLVLASNVSILALLADMFDKRMQG